MPAVARWTVMTVLSLVVAAYAAMLLSIPRAQPPFIQDRVSIVPLAVYGHLAGGMVAIALGPFQFSRRLRTRHINTHRWMGRTYLIAIAVGGLSGFVLARISQGGMVAHVGFEMLALSWIVTASLAYRRIRAGDEVAHRQWMIRNFSLTFAAVTLRIYVPLSIAFGIPFEQAYPAIAWLCWVPNLAVAEWALVPRITSSR
jgi:uncharacterized membrane protein